METCEVDKDRTIYLRVGSGPTESVSLRDWQRTAPLIAAVTNEYYRSREPVDYVDTRLKILLPLLLSLTKSYTAEDLVKFYAELSRDRHGRAIVQRLTMTHYVKSTQAKQQRVLERLRFIIPPQYWETIIGDILEDCDELLNSGATEKQLRRHMLWEILRAAIRLWPAVLTAAVKRVFSTK